MSWTNWKESYNARYTIWHNPSGAADPTRTQAEENILKDEKRIGDLVHVLRYVADGAGFEIMGRVTLIDKRTGRVYK